MTIILNPYSRSLLCDLPNLGDLCVNPNIGLFHAKFAEAAEFAKVLEGRGFR